jgi:uncharacterized sporulation protein YeaH/YhbH (DUF444 family)
MNYFFDDLALPRLIRTQLLADAPEWKTRRAGLISEGNPTSLHVVRSMRVGPGAPHRHGRRRAPSNCAPPKSTGGWWRRAATRPLPRSRR